MDAIRIPAAYTSLERVAAFVAGLAAQAGLPASAAYRLRLATDEIVSNIIMHGYGEGPGEIEVCGDVTCDYVWLRVDDRAPPFDPRALTHQPRPAISVPGAAKPGGFGLYLVRQAVDEFSYEFAHGTNRNTLRISRNHSGRCS